MAIIPTRPSNDDDFKTITDKSKDMLVYSVLMEVPNDKAFLLFHPEFTDAKGRLNREGKNRSKQFFEYAKNKNFMDAYRATIEEFVGKDKESGSVDSIAEIGDERKDNALKSLLDKAIKLVEKGGDIDPDTMKTIAEIFKKLGVLKDEVETQEPARRYLPIRCVSECTYRYFVESHIESGEIVQECDYCRTRKFAEENGWRFDPTKNLDLPIELTK